MLNKIKDFFHIETEGYVAEWNDLRAVIQIVNVALIIAFGLSVSWFGLAIAVFGLIKDFTTDRHINGILMHLTGVVLNCYFISLL